MAPLALGVLVLIGLVFLGQLFSGADPKSLVKGLRYTGASLLGTAALALISVERVGLGLLLGSMAWALFTGGQLWPGARSYGLGRSRPRSRATQGQKGARGPVTRVRTAWLELELDRETGAMRGTVLQGRYKGQALARMSRTALTNFYREAGSVDGETARLLETYFNRTYGAGWRTASHSRQQGQSQGRRSGRARPDGGMSREEAYAVLGLSAGASEESIRAAHRKLMMQNHPDRGGSGYLAAKINEAKDVLLA